MTLVLRFLALIGIIGPTVFLPFLSSGPNISQTSCLYPSMSDRFGVTTGPNVDRYDLSGFPADAFLDWRSYSYDTVPNFMTYFPTIVFFRTAAGRSYYTPNGDALVAAARRYPGATWIIGNEADTIWQHNVRPEVYARLYNEIYTIITGVDPTAKFSFTSLATVSPLRLEWVNRAWEGYRRQFGVDMPVDVWNIHTYWVNEMHNEWGAEIPAGIDNAVGYAEGAWIEVADSGASGRTVHRSKTVNASAYFAFHGSEVTLYLPTGPDSGQAYIFIDQPATPLETVDLYAPAPGTLTRTYAGLIPPGGLREDRHNIRVQVAGSKNPASSDAWVSVDAIQAPSTASLARGRLEDNSSSRARIVTNIDDHDNLDKIVEQIRLFRQWMVDNGQRNKPLINTEYGILMTEDLGFDTQRVRDFLDESLDRFVNDMQDPDLGMPFDDNRLLQQIFWFSLAQDTFEGRVSHTGLFSEATRQIKPLGQDFVDFVGPLATPYADSQVVLLSAEPTWAIFAGQPSLVRLGATVRNRGNGPSGPLRVQMSAGADLLREWALGAGLARRFAVSDTVELHHDWQSVIEEDRTIIAVVDDSVSDVTDPCQSNNGKVLALTAPQFTDLALKNLRHAPRLVTPITAGETTTVTLQVDLLNLGSLGASAGQISVRFWNGDPQAGGTLIHRESLTPETAQVPMQVSVDWTNVGVGVYDVVAEVTYVAEDSDRDNNRQELRVVVPTHNLFLPAVESQVEDQPAFRASPAATEESHWLPTREELLLWPISAQQPEGQRQQ